jgi:putative ABC transport system permease protein
MKRMSKRKSAFAQSRLLLLRIPWKILIMFLMVALGVGTNAGVFIVDSLLFPALPYSHPEQLVTIRPEIQDGDKGVSAEEFAGLKRQTTVFQDLNASTASAFRLTTPGGSQPITAALVTTGYFQMMGDHFYLGYDFIPSDGMAESNRVAILSHGMWKRLGANKALVGSTISMDERPYTVVGVLAPGLRDRGAPVTVPLIPSPERDVLDHQAMNVIGRLRPGISLRQAQAEIDMALARTAHGSLSEESARKLEVEPLNSASLGNDRKFTIWLLLGVVVFILLMESVSVVSLLRLRSEAALKIDWKVTRGFGV